MTLTPLAPLPTLAALVVGGLWGVGLRASWQRLFYNARHHPGRPAWPWVATSATVLGLALWSMLLMLVGALSLRVPLVLPPHALVRSLLALMGLHALILAAAPRMPSEPRARQRTAVFLALVFSAGCALCTLYMFRRLHVAPAAQFPVGAQLGLAAVALSAGVLSYNQAGRRWRRGLLTGLTYWAMVLLCTQVIHWPEPLFYIGAPQAVTLAWLSGPAGVAGLGALVTLLGTARLQRLRHEATHQPLPALAPDEAAVQALAEARAAELLREREARDALIEQVLRHARTRVWTYDSTRRRLRQVAGQLAPPAASAQAAGGHEDLAQDTPVDAWQAERLHPHEQEALLRDITGQLSTRGAFDRLHRLRDRPEADRWRWVIGRGQVVQRSAAGVPQRIVGVHVDITEQQDRQAQQDRDSRLFSDGPIVTARWQFDTARAQVTELEVVSPNVERLWGYPIEEMMAMRTWREIIEAGDMDGLGHKMRAAFEGGAQDVEHEFRIKLKDGRLLWHWLFARLDTQDGRTYLNGFMVDIDAAKRVELRAQEQARRLEELVGELQRAKDETAMLRESSEFLNSAETLDEAFDIISRAASSIFPGWSGALGSAHSHDRLRLAGRWGQAEEFAAEFTAADCWALRRGRTHHYIDERQSLRCRHVHIPADGTLLPYLCIPMAANGEAVGLLHLKSPTPLTREQMVPLSHRANRLGDTLKLALSNLRLRAGLREQATRDGLTGLYNRRFMNDRLPVELKRCQREDQPLALAMIDVDHFKRFNDQFGHEAGDLVLKALGEVLLRRVRIYDLACRYGGEELALIMPGCNLQIAYDKLEQIRRDVAALRLSFGGQELPALSISAGIADTADPAGVADGTGLLKLADERLYHAKRTGRNRVVTSTDTAGDPATTSSRA